MDRPISLEQLRDVFDYEIIAPIVKEAHQMADGGIPEYVVYDIEEKILEYLEDYESE